LVDHYRLALKHDPSLVIVLTNLGWILSTSPDSSIRNGAEATVLAVHARELDGGRDPFTPMVLAAAYAETGQFEEALRTADEAANLAALQGKTEMKRMIEIHLKAYRAGTAVRDKSLTQKALAP
jgi:hypothetical protein